jgi:outer membrane biosynthesis protein TonB
LETFQSQRAFASFAILASLLFHIALIWFVLQQTVEGERTPLPFSVELVRPPPSKPVPAPRPVPVKPVLLRKAVQHAAPAPIVHAKPQIRAQTRSPVPRLTTQQTKAGPPVMHFSAAGADDGLGLDIGTPNGGTGHGSLGDFDDAVKQRILAAKTYPPGMKYVWNECVIEYRVTVDRTGQLLNYSITGCGNPFLDSAARAAIISASPFPVPPDFGGTQYDVYGSLVYKG